MRATATQRLAGARALFSDALRAALASHSTRQSTDRSKQTALRAADYARSRRQERRRSPAEETEAGRDRAARAAEKSAVGAFVSPAPRAPVQARAQGATSSGRPQQTPKIQVVDLRTPAGRAEADENAARLKAGASDLAAHAPKAWSAAEEPLGRAGQGNEAAAAKRPAVSPLDRIRELTGSDLVRTAGIILRDGGGEIRLTLKPESLGSVRIRLRLADNGVEGRIVVDNPAAKQAFEAGLDALARALAADGFQTASLEVAVSGGQAGDGRRSLEGPVGAAVPASWQRESIDRLEAGVPLLEALDVDRLVNLLA